jgi:hypothetical protein
MFVLIHAFLEHTDIKHIYDTKISVPIKTKQKNSLLVLQIKLIKKRVLYHRGLNPNISPHFMNGQHVTLYPLPDPSHFWLLESNNYTSHTALFT